MTTPKNLRPVLVSSAVIADSERLLRGFRRLETVVLWFGNITDSQAVVVTVIRPNQIRTSGSFDVDARSNADVAVASCDLGLRLIAQIHTHPGEYVGHSPGDDEGAPFLTQGLYSIVVPMYGRRGMLPLSQCGVHIYEKEFLRLTDQQVNTTFRFVPNVLDLL